MNKKAYVYCFVPKCINTSSSAPDKLFFNVPEGEVRRTWNEKVRRDDTSLKSKLSVCEDHFKLQEDVEDWRRYQVLKEAGAKTFRLRLKKGVLPTLFDCQPDRTLCHTKQMRGVITKKQIAAALEQALNEDEQAVPKQMSESISEHDSLTDVSGVIPVSDDNGSDAPYTIGDKLCKDFSCQVNMSEEVSFRNFGCQARIQPHFRSKEAQTEVKAIPPKELQLPTDRMEMATQKSTSAPETVRSSAPSAPPKVQSETLTAKIISVPPREPLFKGTSVSFPVNRLKRFRVEESEDSLGEMSDAAEPIDSSFVANSSDILDSSMNREENLSSYSAESCAVKHSTFLRKAQYVEENMRLMENHPRIYLGLSPDTMCLLSHLVKATKCSKKRIMIVLRKLRLNESFEILGHIFGLSKTSISNALKETIPAISAFLSEFVFWPSKEIIQANMPLAFLANYSKVQSIIDCFEVQIEKPSNAFIQAKTWSDYKKCNTIKFLVSCTPDGFISYISMGFGGRTSDQAVVEESGYLDVLKPCTVVMADRGFKCIEETLNLRNCSLVRPPSVPSGTIMSKENALLTKVVASLRIHVERVIKRIREYALLAPHSTFHHSLIRYVDHFAIIACALSNLQGPIIL